jgi:PEP-CTERM putative exosortase interaction domain
VTVPFIGYRADGSTVTANFTTDGIIDGTGPLADFETFYFGPEFRGLTRVEIPTYDWSLDNLVATVPEPQTSALLLLGSVLISFRVFKRRFKQI